MKDIIKIGNAQAFWGDSGDAAATLLQQQPDLDYITLDYLSEVSLSIMAVQRSKDPKSGYARDFIAVVQSLAPFWKKGSKVKVIANAGGLDPMGCALACAEALKKLSCFGLRIGVVSGDDVLGMLKSNPSNPEFNNLDTQEPLSTILQQLTTANAYLGAKPIAKALLDGADIVITGRVADPSLTVGPCMAHFGWSWDDYDKIAQATVAGHLIECGTQVTGGISDRWIDLPNIETIGFPFVEIDRQGEFTITKPEGSGGAVTVEIVKEQLLYEIGDPNAYISPDAIVTFLGLKLSKVGTNRIKVIGAKGKAPPPTLKVSATYSAGFKAEGTLVIVGRNCCEKARKCGDIILKRMGTAPQRSLVECLGCGEVVGSDGAHPLECVLRVAVADDRQEVVENFSRQMAPMVTAGPPGTTGYTSGRPHIRPVFGYWPCLIPSREVQPKIEMLEVKNGS